MIKHEEMINKMLANFDVKSEYELLIPEFELLDELLRARDQAGLTQEAIAKRMGTSRPVVARIEAGVGSSMKYSPSIATLRKYADAVGCKLQIKLVRK